MTLLVGLSFWITLLVVSFINEPFTWGFLLGGCQMYYCIRYFVIREQIDKALFTLQLAVGQCRYELGLKSW